MTLRDFLVSDFLPSLIYRFDSLGFEGVYNINDYSSLFPTSPAKHVLHYATSGFEGMILQKGLDGEIGIHTFEQNVNRMLTTLESLMIVKTNDLIDRVNNFHETFPNKKRRHEMRDGIKFLNLDKVKIEEGIFSVILENLDRGFISLNNLDDRVYIRPFGYRDEKFNLETKNFEIGLGTNSLRHECVFEVMAANVKPYLHLAPKEGPEVIVLERNLFPHPTKLPQILALNSPMRTIKSASNYGLGGLGKNLANYFECDEILLFDSGNYVLEGGGENVFCVIDETLYTPSLKSGILAGTKRDLVINMAGCLGVSVEVANISLEDFIGAKAAAFSGTWTTFVPLQSVYHWEKGKKSNYCKSEILNTLQREYQHLMTGDPKLDSSLENLRSYARTILKL
jgi:branched-subunit amino acid aminotransferase/4-amino-4-deoxychorismate lyase